jgi:hypothetical protein
VAVLQPGNGGVGAAGDIAASETENRAGQLPAFSSVGGDGSTRGVGVEKPTGLGGGPDGLGVAGHGLWAGIIIYFHYVKNKFRSARGFRADICRDMPASTELMGISAYFQY